VLNNHLLTQLISRMKLLSLIFMCILSFSTYAYIVSSGEYESSLKLWKSLKLKNYNYTTYTPSGQLPITTSTTITVKNGIVVKRLFAYNDQSELELNAETGEVGWTQYSWVEDTPGELGTHNEGFIPITLDTLYSQCSQDILVQDPVRYYVDFETDNNGLVSRCTYYPQNEVDGEDRGVFISSINY
jgi:hypothetical protein